MLLVGLTGGIGSGKTTVAAHAARARRRHPVGRRLRTGGGGGRYPRVRGRRRAVRPRGRRARRRARPSGDRERRLRRPGPRAALERIVHPEVRRRIAEGVAGEAGSDRVVVVDSPLLIETGAHRGFPVVVVVSASTPTADRAPGPPAAWTRTTPAPAWPRRCRSRRRPAVADVLLDNEGTTDELEAQVDRLWTDLSARAAQP